MPDDEERKPLTEINHRWAGRALASGKVAASAARLASRRLLGRAAGTTDGLIGESLARELDSMKGLAMKVGQILSYMEGVLPAETHEALRKLQRGAQPVALETLAPVIEEALGRPLGELFDAIDPVAVAAASIGQVHRAVHRGAPVAVKIQYPRVRETLDADFARLGALARLASIATAVDGAALAEELRDRVLEECDYLREADHQDAFARAFAGDREIVIPEVIRERSASTVLTTRWHDGDDFYTFAEHADRDRRSAAGLLLARFAYRSLFGLAAINADPHPGNYLFPRDGAVVFLDFGCVRRFEPSYVDIERALTRVVITGAREKFRDALLATGMVPRPKKFDFDSHWALLRHQWAPYTAPRFRFTFEYLREGLEYSKPDNPNLRHLAIPPPWIWQQRLQFGLHAVLARLDAEADFREVLESALDEPPRPLPQPGVVAGTST
ncbi:MAG: AarF/ABC1/UbiB kinase family protein [Myxococcota bacterium]|nr:AarF/ABC1/UbiB kinase family protein [Myxococcota bacterium]